MSMAPQKKCTGLTLPAKRARKRSGRGRPARAGARTAAPRPGRSWRARCPARTGSRARSRPGRARSRCPTPKRRERVHDLGVERGHGLGLQRELAVLAALDRDPQLMGAEVELDLERRGRRAGIDDVVSPRGVTYSVTCHQWLTIGACARRILPTICVQRCSVSRVAVQSSTRNAGQFVPVIVERLRRGQLTCARTPSSGGGTRSRSSAPTSTGAYWILRPPRVPMKRRSCASMLRARCAGWFWKVRKRPSSPWASMIRSTRAGPRQRISSSSRSASQT